MSPLMGGRSPRRIRATHDQRDAVWKALDQAMEDGQLDRFEHFERTRQVHATTYVDELYPFVDDLQGAMTGLPGREHIERRHKMATGSSIAPEGRAAKRAAMRRNPARRLVRGVGAALVVLFLAVVISAIAGDDESTESTEPSETGYSAPTTPGALHSPEALTRTVDSVRDALGDERAQVFTIHREHATLMRTSADDPGTNEHYTLRGGWQLTGTSANTREAATFDLSAIDTDLLGRIVDEAPRELSLEGVPVSWVTVTPGPFGDPRYQVSLESDGGYGSVKYETDGSVLEVRPA